MCYGQYCHKKTDTKHKYKLTLQSMINTKQSDISSRSVQLQNIVLCPTNNVSINQQSHPRTPPVGKIKRHPSLSPSHCTVVLGANSSADHADYLTIEYKQSSSRLSKGSLGEQQLLAKLTHGSPFSFLPGCICTCCTSVRVSVPCCELVKRKIAPSFESIPSAQ